MWQKLKANRSLLVAFAISLACLFIAMFFLEGAGFSIEAVLLFDIYAIKGLLFSANFWLFILFFCIANSTFLYLFASKSRVSAILASVLSSVLAFLLTYLFFPSSRQLIFVIPFYLTGLFICEEIVKMRLNELKRFKTIRSLSAGMSKLIALVSIGLFVAGAIAVFPQQEQYAEKFEQSFIKSFIRLGLRSTTDAVVNNQRQLILTIIESNEFRAMENAECEANKNFSLYLREMAQEINSANYREEAMKEVSRLLDDEEFLKRASEHVPLKSMTRSYGFLILPINAALTFWIFGQILINAACTAIGTLFIKLNW